MIDFYNEVLKEKENLLTDLKTLCQIPSALDKSTAKENQPFGAGCRQALDAMLAIGKRDGFVTDDVDGYAGSIDIGEGEDVFGILGHLDVVPVNKTGWNYPQFDATLDGDRLYGRGVADDKGPLLAAYYAAKIVNRMQFDRRFKMRVIFGCDEENGSSCVDYYFKHRPYPAMGFTPDADFPVVYGEKAISQYTLSGDFSQHDIIGIYGGKRFNVVPSVAEAYLKGDVKDYEASFKAFLAQYSLKGMIGKEGNVVKLLVKGRSAHGSMPQKGINAVVYLCHYLNSISKNVLVDFVDRYFFEDTSGKALGIANEGRLGTTTVNLGALNYKEGHAQIKLDIRYSDELTHKKLQETLMSHAKEVGFNEKHNDTDALYVDPNSELVTKLHASYVEYTNDHDHHPQVIGGGTYAKEMPNCVAFGAEFPGRDNHMHEDNETILLDELLKSTAIYAKALYDLIKK